MVSPVGDDAVSTCAALRAGISRVQDHPFYYAKLPDWPPTDSELAQSAFVEDDYLGEPLEKRLMRLALAPARELLTRGGLQRAHLSATMFAMCLPSTAGGRPGLSSPNDFQTTYLERLGIEPAQATPIRQTGTSAMLAAVGEAVARIRQREVERAIVLGVDSYLDKATMAWLDETGRLHTPRNPDGFVPGEAAVIVLVEAEGAARTRGATPVARVVGSARGEEPATILSDRFTTGAGLSRAIVEVIAAMPEAGSSLWGIGDLNGQSYRAQEWAVVQTRLAGRIPDGGPLWHPAESVGDVGAAAGGLMLAMAGHAFSRRCAPGRFALVWGSGESGERAACVLQAASEG